MAKQELVLEDGKYAVVFDDETGALKALRHGEPWRDLAGDKLVFALFSAVQELQRDLNSLKPHPDCDRACMFQCQQSREEVSDEMALAFHRALDDSSIGAAELDEIKLGLRAALQVAR